MNVRSVSVSAIALALATAGLASAQTADYSPMTRSEQVREYLKDSFGLDPFGHAAAAAEFDQLTNTPSEWDDGAPGYGARLANAFAHNVVRQTLKFGVSSLLHEDTRYIRSGRHGFWPRTKYALLSAIFARRPNGRRTFSFAGVGSAGGAAAIARVWLPRSIAGAGSAGASFGITLAGDAGSNMLREFWPDLKRHFGRD